ncbi:MAG: sulfatase-like hydrolase/transferase, partial [Planctomycetota bacterium]
MTKFNFGLHKLISSTTAGSSCSPSGIPKQPVWILFQVTIWFALLSSLIEIAILAIQMLYLDQILHLSKEFVWMIPLANVIFFAIPTLFFLFADLLWPKIDSLRFTTFVLALLGCMNLLFMYTRIHHYAALLLAFGIAVQTSRFIMVHRFAFRSLVHRTVGWMAGLVVVMGVSVQGWQMIAERQALAKLPAAPANAPNVLLITLDTVRAWNLSLYGYHRPTSPQLTRLAKTGVVFEHALSTAPWTLPSHASMFTGRFPYELSTGWRTPLDSTYPTLAEFFSTKGYHTAGFVANL